MSHFVAVIRPSFGDEDWKPLELAAMAEVAEILGISKSSACDRRKAHTRTAFPEPVAELSCGAIWLRSEIERYARQAGLPR
jgi:prophage regulatory protein